MDVDLQVNSAYIPLINSDKRFLVLRGGAGCFVAGTEVVANGSVKPIEEIKVGDVVGSYNFLLGQAQYRVVTETHERIGECVKIHLKDGSTIECTTDHKFFDGESFVEISKLLDLWRKKSGL